MAFVKCPECGKEISDKAVTCTQCGFPMQHSRKMKEEKVCTTRMLSQRTLKIFLGNLKKNLPKQAVYMVS